jgi:hypothetical protein
MLLLIGIQLDDVSGGREVDNPWCATLLFVTCAVHNAANRCKVRVCRYTHTHTHTHAFVTDRVQLDNFNNQPKG